MKKSYYLFNPGRMSRKDNTLQFIPVDAAGIEGTPKYIPVESVANLYAFGALDANSSMYNFLGKEQISVHFFDYHEHYTGSFMPKDYLLSGKVLIAQTQHYTHQKKRLLLAQKFVSGATGNMLKNLKYYHNRDKDTSIQIDRIEDLSSQIWETDSIEMLMGIEGNIRITYYSSFDTIINDFEMGIRSKQPPSNEVNALISFINSLCYTLCLDAIYHTQLHPTISFLHQPGFRRYSLALDLAEIFKPILSDRLIFTLLNKKIVTKGDFDIQLNSCLLKESGRKKVVKSWDERLSETIMHRSLKRNVSYKHLVKLECYKLVKHILDMEGYQPFKAWW
ncbi:type I-B CRISPR-associated endonuclease Cas1b [Chitinophaga pendula]|uniref:type I-B CRISPR-associated endonuclease Cas1b n=1 Tax=Chitinophaga TaxID=79328 RepID=UPI000BAFB4B2|nr:MULTISPECIES: type I-B CRISPR-associated endonuclease Cas1b [Chitinophaga]ASZ11932.1 subtype I-B CRISPR-associated endonuclease Cas1 [Chitinophaga sp. MD30]UCJ05039.1 type I-B CRISPR-associated endonuclease Cas1b [Chitinophaga pendula]